MTIPRIVDPLGEAERFISDYWLTDESRAEWLAKHGDEELLAYSILEFDRGARIMRELLYILDRSDTTRHWI